MAQDFNWKRAMAAGTTLELRGINGDIRVTRGTGQAEVTAIKRARRGDPGAVKIEVFEEGNTVAICAVYPWERRDAGQGGCNYSGSNRRHQQNDTRVDFTVQLPDGVHLTARTVNGSVAATGLSGDVDARTVNGSVEVATTGRANVNTVNGGITAVVGKGDGDMSFETVNGDVTVTLPSGIGAKVHAGTVNGSITSDFPITVQGKLKPRSLRGAINGGGRELRLGTVNGNIAMRRGS